MTEAERLEIEAVAQVIRKDVRKKAGLKLDWGQASNHMKEFYRKQAEELLINTAMGH